MKQNEDGGSARGHSPKYRRQSPDRRRQALIDATLRCITTVGVEKSSIRVICEEADVSVGLVNHYFPSKEALVAEAYRQIARDLLAAMQAGVAGESGGARARFSAFFRASFSPVNLDPGLLRAWMAFWSMMNQSDEIAAVHAEAYRAYREVLERLIGDLAAERPFARVDSRMAAIGLSALLDGLWLEWCLKPDTFTPEEGVRLSEVWLDALFDGDQSGAPGSTR